MNDPARGPRWSRCLQGISGASAIAAGSSTACATLGNGSVKCWGRIVGTEFTDYATASTIW
ncbi:MAG: hypothetical protein ABW061_00565 [Polyangiaceae bacterium]